MGVRLSLLSLLGGVRDQGSGVRERRETGDGRRETGDGRREKTVVSGQGSGGRGGRSLSVMIDFVDRWYILMYINVMKRW